MTQEIWYKAIEEEVLYESLEKYLKRQEINPKWMKLIKKLINKIENWMLL